MKKLTHLLLLSICLSAGVHSSEGESYLNTDKPFLTIEDINRQSEAWGTCSATYRLTSMLFADSQPAQAEEYKNYSNGAKIAVIMANVGDALDEGTSPARFSSIWAFSKALGDSIPESQFTRIMADAESLRGSGLGGFETKLLKTMQVCLDNLEGQQNYIDLWRELAKSGLLEISK